VLRRFKIFQKVHGKSMQLNYAYPLNKNGKEFKMIYYSLWTWWVYMYIGRILYWPYPGVWPDTKLSWPEWWEGLSLRSNFRNLDRISYTLIRPVMLASKFAYQPLSLPLPSYSVFMFWISIMNKKGGRNNVVYKVVFNIQILTEV